MQSPMIRGREWALRIRTRARRFPSNSMRVVLPYPMHLAQRRQWEKTALTKTGAGTVWGLPLGDTWLVWSGSLPR